MELSVFLAKLFGVYLLVISALWALRGGAFADVLEEFFAQRRIGTLDVDRSYVGRIIRLALLAPDIVEAIVAGREPSGLSLERLVKGMPVVWEEQRNFIGT